MKFPRLILISIAMVATVAALGGCGSSKSVTGATPSLDTTPPGVPAGFSSFVDPVTNRTFLQWAANSDADVAGYQVYVYSPDPTRDNAYVLAGQVSAAQTSFALPVVAQDTQMYLRVNAVDTSGNHSALSVPFVADERAIAGGSGGSGGGGDHHHDHP